MEKTEYDQLRITEILAVFNQDMAKEDCGLHVQRILKKYAGKSSNGLVSYALQDLECFLAIYPSSYANSLMWYKPKEQELSYSDGIAHYNAYLHRLDQTVDMSEMEASDYLYEFYQRWLVPDQEKIEIEVLFNQPYHYTVFKERGSDNYFINVEKHIGGASGSLDYRVPEVEKAALKALLAAGKTEELPALIEKIKQIKR